MRYANSREESLSLLQECATPEGYVRLTFVAEVLMEPEPTEVEVAAIYRRARACGVLPEALAVDPRYRSILAMDT